METKEVEKVDDPTQGLNGLNSLENPNPSQNQAVSEEPQQAPQESTENAQKSPPINDLDFERYLTLSGYAKNTIRAYMLYFELLKRYGEPLTQEKIDKFCHKFRHQVARSFLRCYLRDFLKNKEFEIRRLRGRKAKRIPSYLTYDEVLLFADCTDPRTSLMIRLMFEGGLRISELLSLRRENVNLEKKEIRGIGKGNKEFIVNFKEKTKELLQKYFYLNAFAPSDLLFPISARRAEQIIAKDSFELFGKKITPHALRHSCGTYLREQGWDLRAIQAYLRHERLETVGIYTHLAREEIKNKFKELEDGK